MDLGYRREAQDMIAADLTQVTDGIKFGQALLDDYDLASLLVVEAGDQGR